VIEKSKILLVDDKPENLIAMEALFSDFDTEIVKAQSGNEALAAVLECSFSVVLLDVRMPGMDGFETARYIRGQEETKALPIIFVTAEPPNRTNVFEGYESGAVDFLSKPLIPEFVRAKVKVFIELDQKTKELDRTKEIEVLYERLRDANEELKQCIHIASHDMREPVRRMPSLVDLIKLDIAEKNFNRLDPSLKDLNRSAEEIVRLVDSFRMIARISSDKLKIDPVDLNEVINNVLSERQADCAQRGISMEVTALPTIEANAPLVAQLFRNLVDNAISHTRSSIEIRISGVYTKEGFVINFLNTGGSIDKANLEAVLRPLARITFSSKEQHSGIGLSVCKRIVEKHGGRIWIESEENWVRVRFTLGKEAEHGMHS